jgi:hypothetical protein
MLSPKTIGTDFPTETVNLRPAQSCTGTHEVDVGSGLLSRSSGSAVSDDELEQHIQHCTHLMELAYGRYEATGCFSDRGEADRWRLARDEAVKARSPAQVAKMERERGLA